MLGFDAQGPGILKVTAALEHLHATHFCQLRDAAGELCQNGVFPGSQLRKVDTRSIEDNAAMSGFPGRSDVMGGVQERFGRNAPAIQAHPAKTLIALDKNDLLAQIRGIERRGITARTSAENHKFSLQSVHSILRRIVG